MKKLNAKIDVFFNAQKRDYYIRIRTSRREELPSYEDMTTDEQKQLLCAEYPEIANLLRKKKPSDEEIELDIDPKIKEYNERTRAMVRRRWKLFYCGSLRQINDEADSIILDKKVTTFTDLKYEGSLDDSAIIKFIQDHQSESGKDIYIAFECSECGQIEFGRLINGKATCTKCGHAIALTDNNVSKFFGENALMRAAQSVNEKKAKKSDEQQNASPAYLPKARSFYYNKTTYLVIAYGDQEADEKYFVTFYTALTAEDYCKVDNIDYSDIVPAYRKALEMNPDITHAANDNMLKLLTAFDKTHDSQQLKAAEDLCEWIIEVEGGNENEISILNKLQIVKRKRKLTESEMLTLVGITENKDATEDVKFAAYLLMDNLVAAKAHFSNIPIYRQEKLKQMPIYKFWPQK